MPEADLLERLGASERSVQRAACDEALGRLREEPALLDSLHALLRDGDLRRRFGAAFVLFHAGRPGLRLLPALLDALELADGDLRWSAVHMLVTLGRMAGEVLPVLLHTAGESPSAQRRRMALYALRELAPERPETLRALLAALNDREPEVRRAGLSSLAKLREPDREALYRVLQVLGRDPDPRMRRIAAVLLPDLLQQHPDATPDGQQALQQAARSGDPALARAASVALERLQGSAPPGART